MAPGGLVGWLALCPAHSRAALGALWVHRFTCGLRVYRTDCCWENWELSALQEAATEHLLSAGPRAGPQALHVGGFQHHGEGRLSSHQVP